MIASQNGPAVATTRHVLHALSLHMNQHGENAWPSQAHLAMRTGLSERAVRGHLDKAWRAGWLQVYEKRPAGNGWRLHEYVATVPTRLEDEVPLHPWEEDPTFTRAEPDAARYRAETPAESPARAEPGAGPSSVGTPSATLPEPERAANGAARAEPGAMTCGKPRQDVRHHVPTNSSITLSKNSPEEGELERKPAALPPGIGKAMRGEKGSARREALAGQLLKATQQYPEIEDAKLAQIYGTDLETVQAARKAAR